MKNTVKESWQTESRHCWSMRIEAMDPPTRLAWNGSGRHTGLDATQPKEGSRWCRVDA